METYLQPALLAAVASIMPVIVWTVTRKEYRRSVKRYSFRRLVVLGHVLGMVWIAVFFIVLAMFAPLSDTMTFLQNADLKYWIGIVTLFVWCSAMSGMLLVCGLRLHK
jgi:hypothetical protein